MHDDDQFSQKFRLISAVEFVIFNVRWLLIPFYLGLIFALFLYLRAYYATLFELYEHAMSSEQMMMSILELVDIVMIANLIKMSITGSYNSFVSKKHSYDNENISSGMLKIKMGTSIVGVSSIHILQQFVAHNIPWDDLLKLLAMHAAFLLGALVLAFIEYLHDKGESIHTKH